MDFLLLPENSRWRTAACLGYAGLWPFVPAVLCWSAFFLMDRLSPGMLTWGQVVAVQMSGTILAAAGSAFSVLSFPVRYWGRIAGAVICFLIVLIVLIGFGLWSSTVDWVMGSAIRAPG